MRDLLIKAQTREPAPRQVHAQFLDQFALAANAVEIADQQNAQQQLRINRRSTGLTVAVLQLSPHELKTDVLLDEPQQMVLGNLIFQEEIVEQRFRAVVLPHHDQQASENRNQTEHGRMLPSNMLLAGKCLALGSYLSLDSLGSWVSCKASERYHWARFR